MIDVAAIAITSFNIAFANLPDHAYSYDGVERDISGFYEQTIPNVQLRGTYDKNITWAFDTGIHTDKLDTFNLELGYQHSMNVFNSKQWTLRTHVAASVSYANHKSCTDSYDRQYHCASLTAFSDFERNHNEVEINPKISISLGYRW